MRLLFDTKRETGKMIALEVTRWLKQSLLSVCALAMLAATVCGAETGEPRDPALPNFHQVNANLYRGAQPKPGGLKQLFALGVKTIINLRDTDDATRAEEREAHALGLRYYNIPLPSNSRPKPVQVEHVLALINAPENFPVFVHCHHGADRTGTIIACYRIANEHWAYKEARAEAKRYGLHWTQRGMKDFIKDFARDHAPPLLPAQKAVRLQRPPALFHAPLI
jgi:protein tyrosine phosphatase (PTP) superfamily phosphohydrolase (DUF442 family)